MAHLWIRSASGPWAVFPLSGDAFDLTVNPPAAAGLSAVTLHRTAASGSEGWVLLAAAGSEVWVNGAPLAIGIHAAADRDEIRVGRTDPVFFSEERLAAVEKFPGAGRPIVCPRCRQEIPPETEAVRCPQCGVWYHQCGDLPCYTYAPTCALCPQQTSLSSGYAWSPEEL